ncbi:hypothetical protein GCM10027403_28140 [Arthrobacter tecti]
MLPWLIRTVIPERTTDVARDGVKRRLARAIPTVPAASVGASTAADRIRLTVPGKTRTAPAAAVPAAIPVMVVSAVVQVAIPVMVVSAAVQVAIPVMVATAVVRAVSPVMVVSAVGGMHARNVANAAIPVLRSAGPRRGTAAVPGRNVLHERVRADHSAMTIHLRAAGTAAEVVPNAAVDVGTPMTSAGGAVAPQESAGTPVQATVGNLVKVATAGTTPATGTTDHGQPAMSAARIAGTMPVGPAALREVGRGMMGLPGEVRLTGETLARGNSVRSSEVASTAPATAAASVPAGLSALRQRIGLLTHPSAGHTMHGTSAARIGLTANVPRKSTKTSPIANSTK